MLVWGSILMLNYNLAVLYHRVANELYYDDKHLQTLLPADQCFFKLRQYVILTFLLESLNFRLSFVIALELIKLICWLRQFIKSL